MRGCGVDAGELVVGDGFGGCLEGCGIVGFLYTRCMGRWCREKFYAFRLSWMIVFIFFSMLVFVIVLVFSVVLLITAPIIPPIIDGI